MGQQDSGRAERKERNGMKASQIFNQNNGDVTKAYYAEMNGKGFLGQLAVALFRAQKRSTAAKNTVVASTGVRPTM